MLQLRLYRLPRNMNHKTVTEDGFIAPAARKGSERCPLLQVWELELQSGARTHLASKPDSFVVS